jgi:4-hydroxy-3-methylbut-2-en-1-yl diphosphate synthase IspG/GcpE
MVDKGLYYYIDSESYRNTKVDVLKAQMDLINAVKQIQQVKKTNSDVKKLRKEFHEKLQGIREQMYKYEIKLPPIADIIVEKPKKVEKRKIVEVEKIEIKKEDKKDKNKHKDELTRIRDEIARLTK